jgi:hypothetical protein
LIHLLELATGKERRTVGKALEKPAAQPGVTRGGGGSGGVSTSPAYGRPGSTTMAFAPDSRSLAQGLRQTLTVWDVASGAALASFEGHRANIGAVAFAPDGRSVATGSGDTTALIWDVQALAAKAGPRPRALTEGSVKACWADLASDDAGVGYEALCNLVAAPKQALPLLQVKLQPAPVVEAGRMEKLIEELGSAEYKVRQKAQAELLTIGNAALPHLEKALGAKVPLETQQRVEALYAKLATLALAGERLRLVRAVEVLERIGDAEARAVLRALADGGTGALATTQAQAALRRLARN